MKKVIYSLLIIFLLAQCISVKQGVEGKLIWVEGNQMPGPGRKPAVSQGVAREVYVYPLLSVSDVKMEGVFVSEVNKPLLKKVRSDQTGKFTVSLQPGQYSLLIKENEGLFVNVFDVQNHLNPIIINLNKITRTEILINHKAVY